MLNHQTQPVDPAQAIAAGDTALGIELGSTRVKAVLAGPSGQVWGIGAAEWDNQLVDGYWTYPLELVWDRLAACQADLAQDVAGRWGQAVTTVGAIGVSAMMHGYLVFDRQGRQLVGFRTWRNTTAARAAAQLSAAFGRHIPQRWSVAHLYQAILDGEDHVPQIDCLTTLAGHVHQRLTGRRVLGMGDASGMFPLDLRGAWDQGCLRRFAELAGPARPGWELADILPQVLPAGAPAGRLTAEGAAWLDPTGGLQPGIECCPPEGDAQTGLVATNATAPRTGSLSIGTSIFATAVLERELVTTDEAIDVVVTPQGHPAAMAHCNNGASELNAWCRLFAQFAAAGGADQDQDKVFAILLGQALEGAPDGGGLMAFNYLSGEPLAGLAEGRPVFLRTPGSRFELADFMRVQVYAALATLRLGLDRMAAEGVEIDRWTAQGGLFRTADVAQRLVAAALDRPVAVARAAGEGGAWGMALLAQYRRLAAGGDDQALADFLDRVFASREVVTVAPQAADVAGFASFLERHGRALPVERAAVEHT
ncbi:MAG: ATPase [Propionibacteriaceae bacterium]|jgi:sugar (pentulose or hexulose) kinase|nr:ATPase [Propionibacteriaceae bacterium]